MQNDLTQGNILKRLLTFALPFLAANLLQALYGATDLFVVGQFSATSAISAVNIGSQIMQIISSFVIGCSMGTTVSLGQHIGARDEKRASQALGSTIVLFSILALAVTPVMFWQADNLARLMHTPGEALAETVRYVSICAIGIPFIIAFNVSAAVLRGMGDSKTPMYIVLIACIINVAGDLVLTGLCGMGVTGVAIATSSAQAVSSVCGMIMMKRHGLPFPFHRKHIRIDKRETERIVRLGLPIALQDTLINISFMVITIIANSRSLIASSAVGVVEKIIMFMFLVPSSMLSAISAITAQNVGAGKPERAEKTFGYGVLITGLFGMAMCGLSWLIPETLTGLFAREDEVIHAAGEYLKTYSIDCVLVAVTFCANGYLCGIGKSYFTFIHNVIAIFLVRIPAAYFLSAAFPDSLLPMGLASPLGSCLSILFLAGYFLLTHYRQKESIIGCGENRKSHTSP